MPTFEKIHKLEARLRTAKGKRQEIIGQYVDYIKQLSSDSADSAGKLVPDAGESKAAVRRRLGDAMRFLGVNLEIKTDQDAVYFWIKPKRGRKPAALTS